MLNLFLIKNKDEASGNYLDTLSAHELFFVTFVPLRNALERRKLHGINWRVTIDIIKM